MKQGNQFYLEIQLLDDDYNKLDIQSVLKVQFNINDITKIYDGENQEVTYDYENNVFKVWLTETETFVFDEEVFIDARILFKNNTIDGTYKEKLYFHDSVKKENLINDNIESN